MLFPTREECVKLFNEREVESLKKLRERIRTHLLSGYNPGREMIISPELYTSRGVIRIATQELVQEGWNADVYEGGDGDLFIKIKALKK